MCSPSPAPRLLLRALPRLQEALQEQPLVLLLLLLRPLRLPFRPGSNLFSLGDNRRYDEELLQSRHSASDWLHNVFTLPRSSVLRDIRNPVVTIALWGALVSILQRIMAGSSSKVVSKFASDICIGSAPHSFLVSSLGLLLVFRTNSAYQRFNVSACKRKMFF
jgi:hypothetical protein